MIDLSKELDLASPNLYVGKEIGNKHLKGKVVSFNDDGMEILVLELNDKYFERYLDVGKTYPMIRHKHWTFENGLMLWEVESKSMKRKSSQLLLQWEENIGWNWDLDS